MVARSLPLGTPIPRGRDFHVVIGPRAQRRVAGWMLFALAVAGVFFLMISSRVALDRTAFVLQDLQRQTAVEEARYWSLRLRVAELQAPERIAAVADEMGMVYPSGFVTIDVPGLGEPGPGIEDRWIELKALLSALP